MKRVRGISLSKVALLLVVLTAPLFILETSRADDQLPIPPLIFSEIKIRNDTTGFDEYIEIYNPTPDQVSLAEFFIGYVNSHTPTADQTFTTAVIGDGLLEPGQSLVLAKNELDPNLPNAKKSPFSSLSDSGGTLRLSNLDDEIIDEFAWTATASAAVQPIQYLCTSSTTTCNQNKTQSFQRGKDENGKYVFIEATWQLTAPTPLSSLLTPLPEFEPEPEPEEEVVEIEPVPAETEQTEFAEVDDPVPTLLPPQITELMPNPAPPASDSNDEFVEIYNPNDQQLDLTGYKLQTGSAFTYSYEFDSILLKPFEYRSLFITETDAILSNGGGQARLLDPAGVVVSQTAVYDTADDGQAWALINGAWHWTTTPTPHAANVLTAAPLKLASTKPATKAKAKAQAPAKKPAKKKVAAAKTKKVKKPAAAAVQRNVYQDPEEVAATLHPGILAGVGLLTVVYAAYEYRHDFKNKLEQLKRNRAIRQSTRS